MNLDITFCSNLKCKNIQCDRNQNNYDMYRVFNDKPFISIANFEKCEFWEVENDN